MMKLTRRILPKPVQSLYKVGQSVMTPPNYIDDEIGAMGGRQGRIIGTDRVEYGHVMLDIEWDSITLLNIPMQEIHLCEEMGFSSTEYILREADAVPALPRDKPEDVKIAAAQQRENYKRWDLAKVNAESERFLRIAQSVDTKMMFELWAQAFAKKLKVPFKGSYDRIFFLDDQLKPKKGEFFVPLEVLQVEPRVDSVKGVMVKFRAEKSKGVTSLCDINVDDSHPHFSILQLYRNWFNKQNTWETALFKDADEI